MPENKTRPLTPEEVSKLIDSGKIANEQGVGFFTRWLLKTFHTDPEEAAEWLRGRGYEVKNATTGGVLQFAMRPKGEKRWMVLDPKGMEFQDILDLTFDLVVGGPIIAASATGAGSLAAVGGQLGPQISTPEEALTVPAFTAVGAGLAGAGVEKGRQDVGRMIGITKTPDYGRVLRGGMLASMAPGVADRIQAVTGWAFKNGLRATAYVAEKVREAAQGLSALAARVPSDDVALAASKAARVDAIIKGQKTSPMALLDEMRGTISRLRAGRFPEAEEVDALLESAAKPIKLQPILDSLREVKVGPIGEQKIGIRKTLKVADDIAQRYGFKDAEEAISADAKITAKQARDLRETLDELIDFSGRPGQKTGNKRLKDSRALIKKMLVESLPEGPQRDSYNLLMGDVSRNVGGKYTPGSGIAGKREVVNKLYKKLGEHKDAPSAENFMISATGQGKTENARLVAQFDSLFGTDFLERATVTRLQDLFNRKVPLLTATGRLIGVAGGAEIGRRVAGKPGMVAGGAIAFKALSPQSLLRGAQYVTSAERALQGGIGKGLRRIRLRGGRVLTASHRAGAGASALKLAESDELSKLAFEPRDDLPEDMKKRLLRLVSEINSVPGMSSEERMGEFERRSQEIQP